MSPIFLFVLGGAGIGLFLLSRSSKAGAGDLGLPASLELGWEQSVLESARTGTPILMIQTAEIARAQGERTASDEMFKIAENFQNASDAGKIALSQAVNAQDVGAISAVAERAEANRELGFASFCRIVARFMRKFLQAGGQ